MISILVEITVYAFMIIVDITASMLVLGVIIGLVNGIRELRKIKHDRRTNSN